MKSLTGPAGGELSAVSRTFNVGNLLQAPADVTPGGKTPFAVLSVAAKADTLTRGALESLDPVDANVHYDFRFDEVADFPTVAEIGPLEPVPSKTKVFGTRRLGEMMVLDFRSPTDGGAWRVMGGVNVDSMDEDLTAVSTITAGPAGTGIYKALVPVGDKGPRYFIRLQSP